jgi:predicted transcriptional regulator
MFHYNLEKLSKEQLARLLQLPNSLQKTMIAILELGEATASGVSEKTGRLRATESDYLNRLVKLTYLKKRREKRKTYFSPIISERR